MHFSIRTWVMLAALLSLLGSGCASFDEYHPDDDDDDYGYTAEYRK